MTAGVPRFERKTAFRVFKQGASQLATAGVETTVDFTNIDYDLGSNFDLAANTYIAPLDGIYVFSANVEFSALGSGAGRVLLRLHTATTEIIRGLDLTVRDFVNGDLNVWNLSGQTFLTQGTAVRLLAFVVTGPNHNINTNAATTCFTGFRIQSESRTILGG